MLSIRVVFRTAFPIFWGPKNGGSLRARLRRFSSENTPRDVRSCERRNASRTNADLPALVRIIELFIREEQHHAALLRAFMEDHHIALKRIDWTDQMFRLVRRLAGLEFYLHILISAELIGIVYYRALEAATDCRRLVALCRGLVSDELAHVGFESQLLLALRADRAAPLQTLMRWAHRAFFAGTAGVVWLTHRSVLRQGGYGARSFLGACLSQYAFYLEPVTVTPASTTGVFALNKKTPHSMFAPAGRR